MSNHTPCQCPDTQPCFKGHGVPFLVGKESCFCPECRPGPCKCKSCMRERLRAATQWAFDTGHDHALDFIEGNDCQRCAFGAEENARQYADFAYGICAELNALPHDDDDPADDVLTCEEGWAAFDDGIGTAIQASNLPEECPRPDRGTP